MPTNSSELHRKLAAEAGSISWSDLQRHFARGAVIVVAPGLDLIDAAVGVALDDAAAVGEWLASGLLARAGDDHARAFAAESGEVRAVVVAPWVLVQAG
jgi:hypothetical protein